MSRYEFSLRQEVLMEKGASVLGDLLHHERERGQTGPARVMYDLVWNAKQDVLLAVTEGELNRIEGQFDLARRFLAGIEAGRRMCERGADTADILDWELALIPRRAHRKERPRAVLLAGQPGAGKTTLSAMILRQLEGDTALINGDDYRRYHPNSRTLFAGPGSDSVALTAAFSSAVTEGLIARLSDAGRNLVVEGTGRTVEVPRSTAELLAGKGYTAELAVIAARPEVSLAGTLLRFHRMREGGTDPRPTPLAAHDNVVRALPGNLDVLRDTPAISRVRIWDRELTLLYDSRTGGEPPSGALRRYWDRPWETDELRELRAEFDLLCQKEAGSGSCQRESLAALGQRIEAAIQRTGV